MPSFPLRHTRPCPVPLPAPSNLGFRGVAASGRARVPPQALMAAGLTGQPIICRDPTGAWPVDYDAGYFPLDAA